MCDLSPEQLEANKRAANTYVKYRMFQEPFEHLEKNYRALNPEDRQKMMRRIEGLIHWSDKRSTVPEFAR